MPQTRSAAFVRSGTTRLQRTQPVATGLSARGTRTPEKQQPRGIADAKPALSGQPGRSGARRGTRPEGPEAPGLPHPRPAHAEPTPEATVTQHLAGSGRGGGVTCSHTGVPRHRGLCPAPRALPSARSGWCPAPNRRPSARTRPSSPCFPGRRAAASGPGRARKESEEGIHRKKRRRKPRPARRGAFIRLILATPTLARNQSPLAACARPRWSSLAPGHAGGGAEGSAGFWSLRTKKVPETGAGKVAYCLLAVTSAGSPRKPRMLGPACAPGRSEASLSRNADCD